MIGLPFSSHKVTASRLMTVAVLSLAASQLLLQAETKTISREALLDKIRGGWAGQMIGVAYGAPTEFRSNAKINESPLAWRDGMLENTIQQDDLYVEMTFAKVMDDLGLGATTRDYGRAFRDSKYHLWHANAGARRALNQGIEAPWSGHPKYNFHANDIDFQIEADFIGLMCPGLPKESNKYCDRVGRVMNYGDGLYGGMFVCGMYSVAFFESDARKVVEGGLACIPTRSDYARLIRDLLDWSAENPKDWRAVWQKVQDKWDKDDPCPDGFQKPFNIDAKLNGAYIAFGLLFGGGDFSKTMEVSTRCGQDSDCNPSSAAGVLGVMLGYKQIPAQFLKEMPSLENRKFDFTSYSFNDIVKSTESRALQLIRQTGGKVNDDQATVRTQQPRPPKLEQWNPGLPDRRVDHKDANWTFSGSWKTVKDSNVSQGAGAKATFRFTGVAVAVVGELNTQGGQAEIYLDGKKQPKLADAYSDERTHDNVLWQTYGLRPGNHTLEIIATGKADSRSKGSDISIQEAVVYRPAK